MCYKSGYRLVGGAQSAGLVGGDVGLALGEEVPVGEVGEDSSLGRRGEGVERGDGGQDGVDLFVQFDLGVGVVRIRVGVEVRCVGGRVGLGLRVMMRRLRPISFDISFSDRPDVPEDRRLKRDLEEVISTELSGVMRWCLEGLLAYLAEGIVEPAEVTAKRESMAEGIDSSLLWAHWALEQGMIREVREDGSLVAGPGEDPALLGVVARGDLLNVTEAHEHYESWALAVERIKDPKWIRQKPRFSKTLTRVWGTPVKVVGTMRFPRLVKTTAWRELI